MKIVLFGATGIVGQDVLRECLLDANVENVLCRKRALHRSQHEPGNGIRSSMRLSAKIYPISQALESGCNSNPGRVLINRFGGCGPGPCCRPQPDSVSCSVGFKLRECEVRLRLADFSVAESNRRVAVTARPQCPARIGKRCATARGQCRCPNFRGVHEMATIRQHGW
jgi:hypothetical protein